MATVEPRKQKRKRKQNRSNGSPPKAAAKPNGKQTSEAKEYSLTQQERAAWEMVSLKLEYAKEKAINARHLLQDAEVMKQQWVAGVFQRRAIDLNSKANIDVEKGVLTVEPGPAAPQPPAASPPQDEPPAKQEATA